MKYSEIEGMALINEVDSVKVQKLAESIKENGWIGCPILVYEDTLLTGSHRLAALKSIADDDWDFDMDGLGDIAEDVTDIAHDNEDAFEEEHGFLRDFDLSDIGWMLKGSWVEEYKDEIEEW